MSELLELLPCPFCGSKPTREIKNDMLLIECPECISVGFHNHARFGCRADEEWNTRVDSSSEQDKARIATLESELLAARDLLAAKGREECHF